jgi:hypothetical protein
VEATDVYKLETRVNKNIATKYGVYGIVQDEYYPKNYIQSLEQLNLRPALLSNVESSNAS